MNENLKIRLNGMEFGLNKKTKQTQELEGRKEREEQEIRGEVDFVKGLATGELIHWSLLE